MLNKNAQWPHESNNIPAQSGVCTKSNNQVITDKKRDTLEITMQRNLTPQKHKMR